MAELTINIDFRIQGYQKKETFDGLGDLTLIEYYRNYDSGTGIYSNLKVKETRVYTRDAVTGLLTKRDATMEWYKGEGVVAATKVTEKYYTTQEGYVGNKRARQNLIDLSAMYLLSQVGLVNAKAFWNTVRDQVDDYVNASEVDNLVNAINASAEAYMTAPIKATLDGILNVSYIP